MSFLKIVIKVENSQDMIEEGKKYNIYNKMLFWVLFSDILLQIMPENKNGQNNTKNDIFGYIIGSHQSKT